MSYAVPMKGFLKFHKGVLNILIHVIGILLAIYGVWISSWPLIVVAPIVMEFGHLYNHLRKIEPYPISVLPLQFMTYVVFLGAVYVIKVLAM